MAEGPVVVVGGGIVGLAAGYVLQKGGRRVVLLEKEDDVAKHQSGRNSGVLHSGLYYRPESLKARLAVRGHRLMRAFCAAHGIPVHEVGKVVVAATEAEIPRLRELLVRGQRNGVPDLAWVEGKALSAIEPHVRGLAAVHSPHTAVLDFRSVAKALRAEIEGRGGAVHLGVRVVRLLQKGGKVLVETNRGVVEGAAALVAAGVESDRLARRSGGRRHPAIVPFRGGYYRLREDKAALVRGLIYPVPDPNLPFLGVHITRHADGSVAAGPNAFLALGREAYRASEANVRDILDVALLPGFWRLSRRFWRQALAEARTTLSRRAFAAEVARFLPDVGPDDLLPAEAGIRAQALWPSGELVDDFVLEEVGRILFVRNAPSPAATASLAIAEELAARLGALDSGGD